VLVLPVALELLAVVLELFAVDPHAVSMITNRQLSAYPETRLACIGKNPMTFFQCAPRIGTIRGHSASSGGGGGATAPPGD
jgi:hypothetical protein